MEMGHDPSTWHLKVGSVMTLRIADKGEPYIIRSTLPSTRNFQPASIKYFSTAVSCNSPIIEYTMRLSSERRNDDGLMAR